MSGVSSPVVLSPAVPFVGVAAPGVISLTEDLDVDVGVSTNVPSLPSSVVAPVNVVPSSDGDEDIPLSDVLVVAGRKRGAIPAEEIPSRGGESVCPRQNKVTRPELRPQLLVLGQKTCDHAASVPS